MALCWLGRNWFVVSFWNSTGIGANRSPVREPVIDNLESSRSPRARGHGGSEGVTGGQPLTYDLFESLKLSDFGRRGPWFAEKPSVRYTPRIPRDGLRAANH